MLWQHSSLPACTYRRAAMRSPVNSALPELRRQLKRVCYRGSGA